MIKFSVCFLIVALCLHENSSINPEDVEKHYKNMLNRRTTEENEEEHGNKPKQNLIDDRQVIAPSHESINNPIYSMNYLNDKAENWLRYEELQQTCMNEWQSFWRSSSFDDNNEFLSNFNGNISDKCCNNVRSNFSSYRFDGPRVQNIKMCDKYNTHENLN